jgi:hypothetical protein
LYRMLETRHHLLIELWHRSRHGAQRGWVEFRIEEILITVLNVVWPKPLTEMSVVRLRMLT